MRWTRVLALTIGMTGCLDVSPRLPPPYLFDEPSNFEGVWAGDVGGLAGVLQIEELAPLRYRGAFEADEGKREYILELEQSALGVAGGQPEGSNRVLFTWQDGMGARGKGWLLINRQGDHLTGSSGYIDSTEGGGAWTFIRSVGGLRSDAEAAALTP